MTEQEWLAAIDAVQMVEHLYGTNVSSRKLLLFMCASCRLHPCMDAALEAVADTVEQFADGRSTKEALAEAFNRYNALNHAMRWCCTPYIEIMKEPWLAPVLRDIVGNPWEPRGRIRKHDALCITADSKMRLARPGDKVHAYAADDETDDYRVTVNPARAVDTTAIWPTEQHSWRTQEALRLARSAYTSQDPFLYMLTAEALEDGGCTDAVLLRHLRGPGPHYRGCWALDAVLRHI